MPKFSIDVEARFAQAVDSMNKFTRQVETSSTKMQRSFDAINRSAKLMLAGFSAERIGRQLFEATVQAEKAQQQLQATLRATGYAAGLTAKELDELAQKYSKSTLFDDEDIRHAEIALLRFRDIQSGVFESAIQASLKLATAQGGTAASAAEALGRALEDPVNGLRALRGVMTPLSASQKDLIAQFERTGDKAGAAKIILEQLNKSLGETPNEGLAASANRAGKAWDDLLKSLGRSQAVQKPVGGFLEYLSDALKELDEDIQHISQAEGFDKFLEFARALGAVRHGISARPPRQEAEQFGPSIEAFNKFKAQQGEAARTAERAREAARKLAEDEATINKAARKAVFDAELEAAKDNAEAIQNVLEGGYAKGLITARNYYDARVRLVEGELAREKEAIARQIDEQDVVPSDTVEERARKAAAAIKLRADLLQKEQAAAVKLQDIEAQRTQAGQDYIDMRNEAHAVELEREGKLVEAGQLRLEIQQRALRIGQRQAEDTDEQIVKQRRYMDALNAFNESVNRTQAAMGALGRTERDIENARVSGTLTDQAALRSLDAARRGQLTTLEREADILEEQARRTGDPAVVEQAREARQAVDDLRANADLIGQQTRHIFQDALVDPMIDFVNATKSADEALKSFFNNIAQSLLRIAAQNVAQTIFGTGFLGLFGRGASGGVGSSGGVIIESANGNVMTPQGPAKLERYARGGIATRPQLALFGEGRLPEAYVPLPDGRAIPVALRVPAGGEGAGRVLGPSAVVPAAPRVTVKNELRVSPEALQMTLRDWFEGEMARQMAHR